MPPGRSGIPERLSYAGGGLNSGEPASEGPVGGVRIKLSSSGLEIEEELDFC